MHACPFPDPPDSPGRKPVDTCSTRFLFSQISASSRTRVEETRDSTVHTFLHAFLWWLLNHTHYIDSLCVALALGIFSTDPEMWSQLTCEFRWKKNPFFFSPTSPHVKFDENISRNQILDGEHLNKSSIISRGSERECSVNCFQAIGEWPCRARRFDFAKLMLDADRRIAPLTFLGWFMIVQKAANANFVRAQLQDFARCVRCVRESTRDKHTNYTIFLKR